MRDSTPVRGGIGILDLLGAVFIVLKLTGVISWSWGMVLAPFWIPATIVVIMFIIGFVIELIDDRRMK